MIKCDECPDFPLLPSMSFTISLQISSFYRKTSMCLFVSSSTAPILLFRPQWTSDRLGYHFFYFEKSRERPKSAPYLRLKHSKRTSKCQNFFYSTRKTQQWDRIGAPGPISAGPWPTKNDTGIFKHFCRKTSNHLEGDPLGKTFFSAKGLTIPKKTERGTICDFRHPFCHRTSKN